jgi:hypothetical protein
MIGGVLIGFWGGGGERGEQGEGKPGSSAGETPTLDVEGSPVTRVSTPPPVCPEGQTYPQLDPIFPIIVWRQVARTTLVPTITNPSVPCV